MKRETKLDIIELTRAYIGVGLLAWFGFWSNHVYGMPFVHMDKFITSLGGLI